VAEFAEQDYCWGAWSPDGRRVVLSDLFSHGGPVRVWDVSTGEALLTLLPEDYGSGTGAVAWSPDDGRVLTFSLDDVGRLWDADTGEQMGAFRAPGQPLVAEWSPSRTRFLVGGLSGVGVWNADTLEQVISYPAGDKLFGSWSPDGTAIALAYAIHDLVVYPAWESLEELVAYAKEHCVLRDLTPEERTRLGLRHDPDQQASREPAPADSKPAVGQE